MKGKIRLARRLLYVVALVLSVGSSLWPAWSRAATFQPLQVFELSWASNPEISPDGTLVAYSRNWMDIHTDTRAHSLWIVHRKGGQGGLLLIRPGNYGQAQWSGDSRHLLFIGGPAGQVAQVWVWNRDTGTVRQVTRERNGVADARWSPGARRIAFLEYAPHESIPHWFSQPRRPAGSTWAPSARLVVDAHFHMDASFSPDGSNHAPTKRNVYVVSVTGGHVQRLTNQPYDDQQIAWSADGRKIYFCADRSGRPTFPRGSQIYEVPANGGAVTPVVTQFPLAEAPTPSPDGRYLAYSAVTDLGKAADISSLYVSDPNGANTRELAVSLDRTVAQFRWSADGRSIYVEYPDHGQFKIGETNLEGQWRTIAAHLGPSDIARPQPKNPTFSVASDGTVAYIHSDWEDPGDLETVHGKRRDRLTALNRRLVENTGLAAVSELSFSSEYDGLPIQAWLYVPNGATPKRMPLILYLHGGPEGTFFGDFFGAEPQIYASAGYLVLAVNYRGSGGYGSKVENLASQEYPGHSYDDVMSAVDYAISRGWADPDNLFATGGSAGGLMTAWIVGHTQRFRAAAVQKPVTDWLSWAGTVDDPELYRPFFRQSPWQNPIAYLHDSPILYVGEVTTPTLLVAGEADLRTPVGQSEEFFEALKRRGVDTALVLLPGAYHEYSRRPSQLIEGAMAVRGWFDAHLKARAGR